MSSPLKLVVPLSKTTRAGFLCIPTNRLDDHLIELLNFFKRWALQIELACADIQSDPLLQSGYNAIGFSQGGQFLWENSTFYMTDFYFNFFV